jgi:hypothetical protein
MTPWTWWAGEIDEDTYGLAEAATRKDVIREASQGLKPGDKFRIVEARTSTAAQYEGSDCVPFLRTRNHEIITVGPVEVSPAPQTKLRGIDDE